MAKRPQPSRKRVRKTTRKTTARPAAPQPPSGDVFRGPTRNAEPPRRDGTRQVPGNFHALYDRGFRSSRGLAPAPATRAATPSRRRMARTVPDLEIYYDEATRLPNMIVTKAPEATLTAARRAGVRRGPARAARTPEGAAVDFIRSRGDLWQLSPEDAETIEVVSVSAPQELPPPPRARPGKRARAAAAFDISRLKTVNLIQRVAGMLQVMHPAFV